MGILAHAELSECTCRRLECKSAEQTCERARSLLWGEMKRSIKALQEGEPVVFTLVSQSLVSLS